jgi:hypothetical protein
MIVIVIAIVIVTVTVTVAQVSVYLNLYAYCILFSDVEKGLSSIRLISQEDKHRRS